MKLSHEEREALDMAWEITTLARAKQLLTDLWQQGRLDITARSAGENALCAAILAIEEPHLRRVNALQGQKYALAQWQKEQERKNREF